MDFEENHWIFKESNGFERKSTVSDFENSKASGIINMITQMQQNQNNGEGGSSELPDYENSLQKLAVSA